MSDSVAWAWFVFGNIITRPELNLSAELTALLPDPTRVKIPEPVRQTGKKTFPPAQIRSGLGGEFRENCDSPQDS
jgi:hypothetical protein